MHAVTHQRWTIKRGGEREGAHRTWTISLVEAQGLWWADVRVLISCRKEVVVYALLASTEHGAGLRPGCGLPDSGFFFTPTPTVTNCKWNCAKKKLQHVCCAYLQTAPKNIAAQPPHVEQHGPHEAQKNIKSTSGTVAPSCVIHYMTHLYFQHLINTFLIAWSRWRQTDSRNRLFGFSKSYHTFPNFLKCLNWMWRIMRQEENPSITPSYYLPCDYINWYLHLKLDPQPLSFKIFFRCL